MQTTIFYIQFIENTIRQLPISVLTDFSCHYTIGKFDLKNLEHIGYILTHHPPKNNMYVLLNNINVLGLPSKQYLIIDEIYKFNLKTCLYLNDVPEELKMQFIKTNEKVLKPLLETIEHIDWTNAKRILGEPKKIDLTQWIK